ncbi:MAG TPA: DUF4276 family protein [Chitinophagales bacterium]|nr:DUF4276 family protein [Chitinophagales bacterium]
MIKIGLVGEDPNDTSAIKNLLEKKYKKRVQFIPLLKRINGYQLDNNKVKNSLSIEFEDKKCKFVLYVRDLDAYKSEASKVNAKKKWFTDLDKQGANGEGILLLNIWEIEAMILADIAAFNAIYKTKCKYPGDPMAQQEPKEYLKEQTRKSSKSYRESDTPDIFSKLDFDTVHKRCSYFKEFITEFDQKLTS